ncbi:MAG: hypothetical protein K2W96_03195 [Gemmataceae bacterium]|nr:hypothetical protein [Gemmataceae bacterium]
MRWINTFALAVLIVAASGPARGQPMPGDATLAITSVDVEAGPKLKATITITNPNEKMLLSVQLYAINQAGGKPIGTGSTNIGSMDTMKVVTVEASLSGGGTYKCVAVLNQGAVRIAAPQLDGTVVADAADGTDYGKLETKGSWVRPMGDDPSRIEIPILYTKPKMGWDAKPDTAAFVYLLPEGGGRTTLEVAAMTVTAKESWLAKKKSPAKGKYVAFSTLLVKDGAVEKTIVSKVQVDDLEATE